jgi:uncharacterized protein YqjF (DUF2071 family)
VSNPAGKLVTATWRDLAVLTYEVDPGALQQRLPRGLSLDLWQGKCLVSLVGLRFLNSKVLGVPLPFFGSYPEVNCRFYVQRDAGPELRRGVVFIRQLVPHRLTALAARLIYHEQFAAVKLSCPAVTNSREGPAGGSNLSRVEYGWSGHGSEGRMAVWDLQPQVLSQPESIEEFVTQRHWGYGAQPDGSTLEYRVSRPTWEVSRARQSALESTGAPLWGAEFEPVLSGHPVSALYAQGSVASIHRGVKLRQ